MALMKTTAILLLAAGALLGGCTCRLGTRPDPRNVAGEVLVLGPCAWGTAGLAGEGRP